MKILRSVVIVMFCLASYAEEADSDFSLEDLMNIEVTSVSKHEEKAFTAASAIYVVTQEEIARKGAQNLAEALRGAPGVQVSRRTTNTWEVSIRGFDNLYSNKLLVLIDGRTVYSPIFSGTYWNYTNYPTADIERIEIIRGPGASVWGSNAVNGVINVTTKHSKDTQGGLSKVEYGEHFEQYYLRYGEQLDEEGKLNLRVYGQFQKYDSLDPGSSTKNTHEDDDWDHLQGGFRLDYDVSSSDSLTLSGDVYHADHTAYNATYNTNVYEDGNATGYNLLLNHVKTISSSRRWENTIYFDHQNYDQDFTNESIHDYTWNYDTAYHFQLGDNHAFAIGAGVRYYHSKVKDTTGFVEFIPEHESVVNYNFFIQDKITLQPDRWTLTLGSKFEEHDYSGFEYQPSARLAFTPNRKNTFWLATSRAVRTPNRYEHNSNFFSGVLVGNHDVESEELQSYEFGFRSLVSEKLSFDIALFYNQYDDLTVTEFSAGDNLIVNGASADSYGFEISSNYFVTSDWQLTTSYSYFDIDVDYEENTGDILPVENVTANHQVSLYSHLKVNDKVSWGLNTYYQDGKNPSFNYVDVPGSSSFIKLDTKINWQYNDKLNMYVMGQNLLEDSHAETQVHAEVPRTVLFGLQYKF